MATVKKKYLGRNGEKHSMTTRKHIKGIILVVMVATVGLLCVVAYGIINATDDKSNTEVMRRDIAVLVKDLETVYSGMEWKSGSFCTVVKPRSFGDDEKYSCTAVYKSTRSVANQDEIDDIVDTYYEVLKASDRAEVESRPTDRYPVYNANKALLDKPGYKKLEQISALTFNLKSIKAAKCGIEYELNNDSKMGVVLSSELKCYQDTQKAYFEPIEYI